VTRSECSTKEGGFSHAVAPRSAFVYLPGPKWRLFLSRIYRGCDHTRLAARYIDTSWKVGAISTPWRHGSSTF